MTRRSFLPPDWKALAPLLDELLEAPPAQRESVLLRLSEGQPARLAQLRSIVADCETDTPFLDRPAGEQFASLFDDEPEQPIPELLGDRYRIEKEIGRGGMARVYLANDIKHGRRVAVKVIRPDLAASLGHDRFLREIEIAARLRHPNIVPLYDSGDSGGILYFVMPFEEGESLRTRLVSAPPLTTPEKVSTLRDIARALAYAHEHGIVHRDVKPDNVMLSGGAAVVTDFGISKAVSVAQDESPDNTLTQSGSGIGTPAYMAPEQAVGDPASNHRSDIYSFGCLAYELFAGHPPFDGMPAHQIITAHISTQPTPLESISGDVPPALAVLVGKCLAKDPDARPQSARELMDALENDRIGLRSGISRKAAVMIVAAALSIAVITAFAVRNATVAPAPTGGARTVAVLPLGLVGDSAQRDLADGLSDEIAYALYRVPGIRVISRRGSGNYRGQRIVDPVRIGKELGARFLVMGSLHEENGRLVVLTQLFDATDGTMLWTDRFNRARDDLRPVRDEIARAVGDTLRRTLGLTKVADLRSTAPGYVPNPEAYRLYVLAQRALDRRGQSIQASADGFRQATKIDSMYARAYSGLSLALALTPYFKPVSAKDVRAEAVSTALRAEMLDSTLAQPHIALGLVYQNDYEWEHAAAEFTRAVSLDNHDVEARVQYGRYLMFRGRSAEALAQFKAARAEDPASALVSSWVSYAYYVRGQIDSALVESAHAYQSDSNNFTTLSLGALVRLKAGRLREARQLVDRAPLLSEPTYYVLAMLGDTSAAMQRLRRVDDMLPNKWRTHSRRAFAMLGANRLDAAIDAFERATDAKEIWPSLQATQDPLFNPIRQNPRFQVLLHRVGLQ